MQRYAIGLASATATLFVTSKTIHMKNTSTNDGRQLCDWVKSFDTRSLNETSIDPNTLHPLGWSALHLAATSPDYIDQARALLNRGIDPNIKEQTPSLDNVDRQEWQRWVHGRQTEFSPLIDPYAITTGFTPLHYAVLVGNVYMIKLLIEKGADPLIASAQGHLPRDLFDGRKQDPVILTNPQPKTMTRPLL